MQTKVEECKPGGRVGFGTCLTPSDIDLSQASRNTELHQASMGC